MKNAIAVQHNERTFRDAINEAKREMDELSVGEHDSGPFEMLQKDFKQLVAQRDELIAALEEAIRREASCGMAASTTVMNRWQSVIAKCRLSKTEGKGL